MGIEPTPSAWKAEVLPLNYTRLTCPPQPEYCIPHPATTHYLVEGGGFEPPKAEPSDLQSDPFDHSGTPPKMQARYCACRRAWVSTTYDEIDVHRAPEKHQPKQGCPPPTKSYN